LVEGKDGPLRKKGKVGSKSLVVDMVGVVRCHCKERKGVEWWGEYLQGNFGGDRTLLEGEF